MVNVILNWKCLTRYLDCIRLQRRALLLGVITFLKLTERSALGTFLKPAVNITTFAYVKTIDQPELTKRMYS